MGGLIETPALHSPLVPRTATSRAGGPKGVREEASRLERTRSARSTDDTGGTGAVRAAPSKRHRPTSVGLALSVVLLCSAMAGSAAAAAPSAPTVETESATAIEATGAVLHGTVNPNKAETGCSFEYGTTTSYGLTVPCAKSPGAGE